MTVLHLVAVLHLFILGCLSAGLPASTSQSFDLTPETKMSTSHSTQSMKNATQIPIPSPPTKVDETQPASADVGYFGGNFPADGFALTIAACCGFIMLVMALWMCRGKKKPYLTGDSKCPVIN